MCEYILRKAVREDMDQVMQMIIDLATFEGFPNGPKITSEDLKRDGFDSDFPYFFCIVAESVKTKAIIGYAICNYAYSSWTAKAMYIEDFYVLPELRGQKIGHRIFKEICKVARDSNCKRIDWHTLTDNPVAIKFYESHGAYDVCKDEQRTCYRIKIDKIIAVANAED